MVFANPVTFILLFSDDTESKENDDDNLEGIVVTYKYLRQVSEIALKMLLQSRLF